MIGILLSSETPRIDWSEAPIYAADYGPKGAGCLTLPRAWVPPFALVPAETAAQVARGRTLSTVLSEADLARVVALGSNLIVRSSVLGETIWDRGTYHSEAIAPGTGELTAALDAAASKVINSAKGNQMGLVVQSYIDAAAQGEFGNLHRISKTRDQWELNWTDRMGSPSRTRLNSQRDVAADPSQPILVRAGLSQERLFGSIAAWLNNELVRGRAERLNCEWVTDNKRFYLVQVDAEDEDVHGINPLQIRIQPSPAPPGGDGHYLKVATGDRLGEWDKLKVLEELWESDAKHKPTLFFVPLDALPAPGDDVGCGRLVDDFRSLIGNAGIIVRTSVRADAGKVINLPRSECLQPEEAARWCLDEAEKQTDQRHLLAFVAHRFVASRASAWVRADPNNPMVEVHALWGLPDALQYCPYDIWEVHLPTDVATDFPDYKSDILRSLDDGGWAHGRVKNEVARANSISAAEARDVSRRSMAIAQRLGRACHIMWFIGCVDEAGKSFNIPWYWTEAHDTETNFDRSAYKEIAITSEKDLIAFESSEGPRQRQALTLRPRDLGLMRNNAFIARVGAAAMSAGLPVILTGSTLAHAYYQLRSQGCAVVASGQKERSRIRRTANLGKLVRDKIPERIAKRQEHEITKQVPNSLIKGFLLGKLLEEAIEVREAGETQKREELADLYEVLLSLIKAEGFSLGAIAAEADIKRQKAGGFDLGLVLVQTGIAANDRSASGETLGQLLADRTSEDTIEIPFSFFGFMDLDQPRSILLEQFGILLEIMLKSDRVEIKISRSSEQLGLPLSGDGGLN